MQNMTCSEPGGSGLRSNNGLSFLCKDMTFTECGWSGVVASNTKGRLINCVMTQCGNCWIYSGWNTLIELEGSQTKVDGNATSGGSWSYGLETLYRSSRIHLLYPLTKESVSTNNQGGGHYGGHGEIAIVDDNSNKIEIINEASIIEWLYIWHNQ